MTAEVIRYLGGPGTGKTHTLLKSVLYERDAHDLKLSHLIFCSFTRSQRDDVRSRIGTLFPDSEPGEIRRQVKTMHGVALSACRYYGLIPEMSRNNNPIITEGITKKPFADFCEQHNLNYHPTLGIPEPGDDASRHHDIPEGNVLFDIARYITQQFTWTPENWLYALRAKGYVRLPKIPDVPGTIRAWEQYKADNTLFEHDDYVNLAVRNKVIPPVRVVVIDEFQDLTPAQYLLYCSWSHSSIGRIYIAGDPNQTIYGFRGANPDFLTKTRATDRGETPISHRCPAQIVAIADEILQKPSCLQPKGPGGIVSRFEPVTADDVAGSVNAVYRTYGEVLVLSRFRKYVHQIARQLSAAGIPVTGLAPGKVYGWEKVRTVNGRTPVDIPVILKILRQLDDYSRDATAWNISPRAVTELVKASATGEEGTAGLPDNLTVQDGVFIEELTAAFGCCPGDRPAAAIIRHLDFDDRICANLTQALSNRIPVGAVRVDTIHAAKGLEAPGVIVDCRYLPGRREGYFRQNEEKERMRAEERRVWYVAATRASEALYFMDVPKLRAPALAGVLAGV